MPDSHRDFTVIKNEAYASITVIEEALHHVIISNLEQDLYVIQSRFSTE